MNIFEFGIFQKFTELPNLISLLLETLICVDAVRIVLTLLRVGVQPVAASTVGGSVQNELNVCERSVVAAARQ